MKLLRSLDSLNGQGKPCMNGKLLVRTALPRVVAADDHPNGEMLATPCGGSSLRRLIHSYEF